MSATAIPHPSLPFKAVDTNQRAELTSITMADFTFAIVVPLASPIQPVATSNMTQSARHDRYSHRSWGAYNFRMIPAEPRVNSSIEEYVRRASSPRSGEHPSAPIVWCRSATTYLCRCLLHPL